MGRKREQERGYRGVAGGRRGRGRAAPSPRLPIRFTFSLTPKLRLLCLSLSLSLSPLLQVASPTCRRVVVENLSVRSEVSMFTVVEDSFGWAYSEALSPPLAQVHTSSRPLCTLPPIILAHRHPISPSTLPASPPRPYLYTSPHPPCAPPPTLP